jgi:hypothetical protein
LNLEIYILLARGAYLFGCHSSSFKDLDAGLIACPFNQIESLSMSTVTYVSEGLNYILVNSDSQLQQQM